MISTCRGKLGRTSAKKRGQVLVLKITMLETYFWLLICFGTKNGTKLALAYIH